MTSTRMPRTSVRGELITSGVIQSRLIYILAVTGGTAHYNNARAGLTVTSLHRTRYPGAAALSLRR